MFDREIEEVRTFGDARRLMFQTIMQIRDGGLTVQQGAAIGQLMKEINSNIQCEINAAKIAMSANEQAGKFGKVVQMGTRIIGSNIE